MLVALVLFWLAMYCLTLLPGYAVDSHHREQPQHPRRLLEDDGTIPRAHAIEYPVA